MNKTIKHFDSELWRKKKFFFTLLFTLSTLSFIYLLSISYIKNDIDFSFFIFAYPVILLQNLFETIFSVLNGNVNAMSLTCWVFVFFLPSSFVGAYTTAMCESALQKRSALSSSRIKSDKKQFRIFKYSFKDYVESKSVKVRLISVATRLIKVILYIPILFCIITLFLIPAFEHSSKDGELINFLWGSIQSLHYKAFPVISDIPLEIGGRKYISSSREVWVSIYFETLMAMLLFLFFVFKFILRVKRSKSFESVSLSLSQSYSNHKETISSKFSTGAEVIDKFSKWALLITLMLYLFEDRRARMIEVSWDRILKFQGLHGDLGRKDSIEKLVSEGVDVVSMDLSNSNLEGVELSMSNSWFRWSPRANFSLSNFSNANLRDSKFYCGILRGTNFSGSYLEEAKFIAADLRYSIFHGARFGSYDIFEVTDFSFSDLRKAKFSTNTIDTETSSDVGSIDLYNTFNEQYSGHGVILYGSDIRGTSLTNEVLNLESNLINSIFQNKFPGLNYSNVVLSVWDKTTKFPSDYDSWLTNNGIRDGEVDKNSDLYMNAREQLQKYYETTLGRKAFNILIKMERERELAIATLSILKIYNVDSPISQVHFFCE